MTPTALRLKRRCIRLLAWFTGWIVLVWLACSWYAAREITSPARRALQDYHHAILNEPAAHGITITPFSLSDGTPVLLCRPDHNGKLDQRGSNLRSQLQQRAPGLAAPGTENNATLVLLHGRGGRKEDLLPVAIRFCATGFRCLLPDLPAHGENPSPVASFGPRETSLPLMALNEAAARFTFPARPAGLWGMSMGGSVAVHTAAANPSAWDALIIVASFDALSPVIERQCGRRLGSTLGPPFHSTLGIFFKRITGVRLDQIQPASMAPGIQAPTLIAHGDDDPLIPLDSARRLFDAIGVADKQWVNVGSGTHGNVLVTAYPLYADMSAWFLTHLLR